MAGTPVRTNCPQWALRIYDGLAAVMLAFAAFALVAGSDAAGTAPERTRDWQDLAAAALLPAVLLFSFWLGRGRRSAETDEYLRRLIGHSAAAGVLATIVGWSSWTMLARGWVAPPQGDQLIGLLLGSCALAYGAARLRDAL